MGKFRSKLKGQSKGKRWPKGQSSSSNPETRKYRNQAKSRFTQTNAGTSGLTSDALKKHDTFQSFPPKASNQEESHSDNEIGSVSSVSSYQTIQTFASDWSNCSNMSYNRFLKVFRSDSALHKEMLAILAAVTEVIKENGGKETSVEYYCSLLTTLEQILSQPEKNETQLTAVLSLLNMGIRSVPEGVLRASFEEVWGKLHGVLREYTNMENNVVIKSVFGILTGLLRAQDWEAWSKEHTQIIFSTLLDPFCIHSKPKWRKSAQKAASAIIKANCFSSENVTNFAANKVALFCKSTLEACLGGVSHTVEVPSVRAAQTTILHTLGLLKETIHQFSQADIKMSCELIIQLMTLNSPMLTSCCLQVFHALFSYQKPVIQPKVNAQLISAIYDFQPSANDVLPMTAWLAVMQQAHIHLADINITICSAALPRIFATITQLWLSEKKEIVTAATHALEAILRDAVAPACANQELANKHKPELSKCFNAVELGLGYQYNFSWHQVLHVIRVMFEVCGENCSDLLCSCLKSLAELRDSYKFSYNNELEYAVGAAIRSMGPEAVLEIISLKKDNGEMNLDRSWMLLVLRENVKRSSLSFWINSILPLAIYCQKRSVQLSENNDGIGAHSSELLHLQLWHSLASFCNSPTDIKTSFKSIAKVLGMAISDRKELRLPVMASLRKLIAYAKEPENKEDLEEIARFDKNFLPILFNVYTTRPIGSDEEGQRLAAFDTIKLYLSITRPELLKQLFNNAFDKLNTTNDAEESFLKESVMDLIRALVPYQDSDEINRLYQHCIKNLHQVDNSKEQKKAYRLLEEICGSEATGCQTFIRSNRRVVQKLLMKTMNSSAVSSKGARLRCFIYLVKTQPKLNHESKLIKSALPEAVLCCKDVNQRCRMAAYELINIIGETLQKHDQMQEFIAMIVAGLAGPVQVISATILALSSILHNFSGTLGQENIQLILENINLLITCPNREIVAPSLSFIKVYCSSLPSPTVAASLPNIVKTLCSMTDDCKQHFRLKVRDIIDRLLRKYSFDAIIPYVPESDTIMRKRLKNLRKLNSRKKKTKEDKKKGEESDKDEEEFLVKARPKSMEEILADSDSEFEDMDTDQPKIKNKKQVSAWIEEDFESIVDFTDPGVSSKITATKPIKAAEIEVKKKSDRGFKTATDGRLIINDISDSDDDKRGTLNFSSDADSDDDNQSKAETLALTDRKRKRTYPSSVKSGISTYSQPPNKYKTGGSGIHRNIKPSQTGTSIAGSEYTSKKAAGDVKKKGKLDPYAYIPLQRSSLNRRKKLKSDGKFKHFIGASKSSDKKGKKTKKNKNRK